MLSVTHRTCSSEKRIFLEKKFPTVCKGLDLLEKRIVATNRSGSLICQNMR